MNGSIVAAAAIAATTLLMATSGVAARSFSPSCAVPPPGNFAGAPPAFEQPLGGSELVIPTVAGHACVLRRGDGTMFARATYERGWLVSVEYFNDRGAIHMAIHMDHAEPSRAARRATQSARPLSPRRTAASCGGDARNPEAYTWDRTINWYLNYGSIPSSDLNPDLTETNLRNAHIEWETNDDWCGIVDASSVNFTYQGRTTASVGRNGLNTVGWGRIEDIGCSSSFIACELTWYNDALGVPDESDVRMDTDFLWENGNSEPNDFDVWHVYAHELGHTIQFGHVADTTNVMYNEMGREDVSNHMLGRGDAEANNAKY
jgi:matrixin